MKNFGGSSTAKNFRMTLLPKILGRIHHQSKKSPLGNYPIFVETDPR